MKCPDFGQEGIRAEFYDPVPEKAWGDFRCPGCGLRGTKDTFTPRKKEAEDRG